MSKLVVEELQKIFYEQISALQPYTQTKSKSSLSVLTDEEIKELEQTWIEFVIWKDKQNQ